MLCRAGAALGLLLLLGLLGNGVQGGGNSGPPCARDEYVTQSGFCAAFTACSFADGQFVSAPGTPTSDRRCKAISAACGLGEEEIVAPTPVRRREQPPPPALPPAPWLS